MTLDERFAAHARDWDVNVAEVRTTETSQLGFGTRRDQPVVLKAIRKENSEEWRCGEVLEAFRGAGIVRPLEYAAGAVLLPRLLPGHDLASWPVDGRDEEATEIIASLVQRMSDNATRLDRIRPVDDMQPEFARFRNGADGFIPPHYVDRAEAMFAELCATQRNVRLLHGDLHHYNVLFDHNCGWVAIDPWGVLGELEFEVGPSLRNPQTSLLADPRILERRLRTYEARLALDAGRALEWAFVTTVLGILWPVEHGLGPDFRKSFAVAARSMLTLLELR